MKAPVTAKGMDFATFIMDLSHGDVNGALSEKLERLIDAVNQTNKGGVLTVKFTVKKEGTMATVHCDASIKLPEPSMPGTMFFFGEEAGVLMREDPRQLTLKAIATPSQPLRSVGGDDDED